MKALWAIDPFHQNAATIQNMHQLMRHLTQSDQNVELGYVVTHRPSELAAPQTAPFEKEFEPGPLEILQHKLEEADVQMPPGHVHIISNPTLSVTAVVDSLLRLARNQKADVVALYTQAREGLVNKLLGSFAETAMHRSRMDLLLMNPHSEFSGRIQKVAFAYDFQKTSNKHFFRAIEYCQNWKAHLIVIHAAEIIYRTSLDESNPEIQKYRQSIDRKKEWIENQCRERGITFDIVIESQFESISEAILKECQKREADLIVIGTKSGKHSPLMGGSVARQIVRTSQIPTLVLRS